MNKIAYCGIIGSGKSHSSSFLMTKGYVKVSFADAVRFILYKTLGLENISSEEYESLKIKDVAIIDKTKVFHKINFRDALISLGNGMRKEFEDTWLFFWDKLFIKLGKPEQVIVDDIRYYNEFLFLWEKGFKIFFTNYKSDKYELNFNPKNPEDPEKLSTAFVLLGLTHGQEILPYDLDKAIDYINQNFPYK